MGWFTWLTRFWKKSSLTHKQKVNSLATVEQTAPTAPHQPTSPLNSVPANHQSIMVVFEHNNSMMVMDRDAYDFTYGPKVGTEPRQQDIDELFSQVSRICVMEGSMLQGKAMTSRVLADVSDPTAIVELHQSLRIVEETDSNKHCHCLGGPTLEFYRDKHLIAVIGLQHGKAIRWKRWHPDADLADGEQLSRWLLNRGITSETLNALYERGNNHLLGEPPDPEYWHELNQLAERVDVFCKLEQQAAALPKINEFIARYPERTEAYSLRATLQNMLGNLNAAVTDYQIAIDRGLRRSDTFFQRAMLRLHLSDFDGAVADTSIALLYQPAYPQANHVRAIAQAQLGQTKEALHDWETAVKLMPDWFAPYLHRAELHHQMGNLDYALNDINRAITLVESFESDMMADLFLRRGDIRIDLFQEEQALKDFAEARRLKPAIAGKLGELWLRRGDKNRALEAFSSMITIEPQDARGYLATASVHLMLEKYEQAIEQLTQAISIQPDGEAYLMRGHTYELLHRDEQALADYQQYLFFHPKDARALLKRAAFSIKHGEFDQSLKDREAAHLHAPDAETANMLAWALATLPVQELRDGIRAVGLAQQACIATEWKLDYMIDSLAAACAEAGQFDDAIRYQQKVLEMMPAEPSDSRRDRQARLKLYQNGQPYRLDQVNSPS